MAERYFLSKDAAGNLGIHNNSPAFPLHIGTDAVFDNGVIIAGEPSSPSDGGIRFLPGKGFTFYDSGKWSGMNQFDYQNPPTLFMNFEGASTQFLNNSPLDQAIGMTGFATNVSGGTLPARTAVNALSGQYSLQVNPGGYIDMGTSSDRIPIDSLNPYSLSFWYKGVPSANPTGIFHIGETGVWSTGSKSFVVYDDQTLGINFYEEPGLIQIPCAVRDGLWHHVKVDCFMDRIDAYVDSKFMGGTELTASSTSQTWHKLFIGSTDSADEGALIDNVCLTNLTDPRYDYYSYKFLTIAERAGFPSGVTALDTLVKQSDLSIAGFSNSSYSPILFFDFNNNILDTGSAGITLSVSAGSLAYMPMMNTRKSLYFSNLLLTSPANAAYQLTGNMTIMAWIRVRSYSSTMFVAMTTESTDAEVDNVLWSFRLANGEPQYFIEYGAGTNETFTLSGYKVPLHEWILLGFTRSSNVIQFYLNGYVIGSPSSTLNAPTGGSNTRLHIGDAGTASGYFDGEMAGLKLVGSVLTPSEILSEAQLCGLSR